jgi:hypothetical protein
MTSMPQVSVAVLAATLAMACELQPAQAAGKIFDAVGGPGDKAFTTKCKAGSYLIGLKGRSGAWMDQLTIVCAHVNADGSLGAPEEGLHAHGGNGGAEFPEKTCPNHRIVYSMGLLHTAANRQVRTFVFGCRSTTTNEKVSNAVDIGNTQQSLFPTTVQPCPDGEAAIGLTGREGKHVNAAGLICDTFKVRGAGTASTTPTPTPTGSPCDAAPAELKVICTEHNRVRANHCVGPLTWTSTLETDATTSAGRCPKSHNNAELQSQKENENLFWSSSRTGSHAQEAFDSWYGEKKNYQFDKPVLVFDEKEGRGPPNGHFTQVVWKDSASIGCAVKVCTDGTYISCRYQPPGNWNAHVPSDYIKSGVDQNTAVASLNANVLNDATCKAFRGGRRRH